MRIDLDYLKLDQNKVESTLNIQFQIDQNISMGMFQIRKRKHPIKTILHHEEGQFDQAKKSFVLRLEIIEQQQEILLL